MLLRNKKLKFSGLLLFLGQWLFFTGQSLAGELVINSNLSDPAQKMALKEVIASFEKEHKNIKVSLNIYDHEAYKTGIRNWLTTYPPDIVTWYGGNRMKEFVHKNLFTDLSSFWQEKDLYTHMASSLEAMTVKGAQWGLPYSYYQWGIYYRKSLFQKAGIKPFKNWQDFLLACKALKESGITPITIGTKYLWPAAGWFDYINLRLNGLEFHSDLMAGKIAYTDKNVLDVFDKWRQVIEPSYYLENHAAYSWQEALSFFMNGKAAMYLIGSFATQNLSSIYDDVGFMAFPIINPNIKLAEEAPMDTLHIPTKAKNKKEALSFLSFVANKDTLSQFNKNLRQLPPHKMAKVGSDHLLKAGLETLNKAKGTSQFYDRDTKPAMAKAGLKGFQEFMIKPKRGAKILKRLEKVRKRVYRSGAH